MSKSPAGLGAGAGLLTRRTARAPGTQGGAQASFVAQFAGKANLRVVDVPLDERLADNPANPPKRVEDLDAKEIKRLEETAASIAQFGLLQPLIVSEVAVYRESNPAVQLDDRTEWVLRVGHRRRRAALLLGMTTLPAIVRTDDAGVMATLGVMLSENVHRKSMTPLQEAQMLGTMRDAGGGLSQRELQKATGISQGQISKRLKLLELAPSAQDAIEAGHINVIDALEHLSKLNEDDQARVIELIVARVRVEADTGNEAGADGDTEREAPSSATVAALVRQITRAEDPQGGDTASPRVDPATTELAGGPKNNNERDIDEQEHHGTSTRDETEQPSSPAAPTGRDDAEQGRHLSEGGDTGAVSPFPDHEDSEQPDSAVAATASLDERSAASQARIEACQRYVNSSLKPTEVTDILVDAALIPPRSRPSRAITLAATWIGLDITATAEDLAIELANRGGKQAQRLAVATVLARREADLAALTGPWDEAARRYVRRLVELGVHELTSHEQHQLDEPLT